MSSRVVGQWPAVYVHYDVQASVREIVMPIVSFTELRSNLAKHLDQVERDHTELIVTRQNREPVVVMSLADFESWKETLYLQASPANDAMLRKSIAELDAGKGIERTLIDP
jgi:antitoxin YefM